MNEICTNIVIHAVLGNDGVLRVDTRELVQLLQDTPVATTIVATISRVGPCMLAYATALYDILVKLDQPTRNLVLKLADVNVTVGEDFDPVVDVECENECECTNGIGKFRSVAVGGTFDRLHAGHRLLLTIAAWISSECLYIGVTAQSMLSRKRYRELIQSFDERAQRAVRFVQLVNPNLRMVQASPLNDSAGIASSLPSLDALVATSETSKSAAAVNDLRASRNLQPLSIFVVELLFSSNIKLSSTALRAAEADL